MTKITIKQAKASHPLASAVLRQLGGGQDAIRSALDAAEHGAGGGFHGFITYFETCAFTKRNRVKIAKTIGPLADECDMAPFALVREFGCLKDNNFLDHELAAALYGAPYKTDRDTVEGVDLIENALAWYALEEVGHAIEAVTDA